MATKTFVTAEREAAAAQDALAVALAHGSAEEKRAAREAWREAERRLARLSSPTRTRRS
jgi:hypothetical protein